MEEGRRLPDAGFDALPFGDDPWRIVADADALSRPSAPAVLALGNGFVGLRGPGGGTAAPGLYLNSVYERVPIHYHEAAHGFARESDTRLPVCDPTRLVIAVEGAPPVAWSAADLDMAAGVLAMQGSAGRVRIAIDRLVAMDRNVIASRITLVADENATVTVTLPLDVPWHADAAEDPADYDPRIGHGLVVSPWCLVEQAPDGRADRLPRSGWTVAVAVAGGLPATLRLAAGKPQTLDLFAGLVAERDDADGDSLARARSVATAASDQGFDALAEAQRTWWAARWQHAQLDFPGLPGAEQAVRHALFQLIQAAGRDGRTSLAAKGQTGEGYEGHVFWDAEIYALPVLAHVDPATARAMLAWRIAHLDEARGNARAMGQPRGALYPWRTIGGRECSAYFPAGSSQYHINADIAFALETYVAATGDDSLLAEGGAEMLAETARIWLQIGFHDPARDGAFVINRVTGPDEYSALVDNNLYTNLMAARHLRYAADVAADRLDPGEAEAMRVAADAMVIPFDEARGVPAQDDAFFARQPWPFAETPASHYPLLLHYHPLMIYRHAVAKQADAVLAAVLLPDRFDRATRRRMLDCYEAVTVHDSTLSASAFATASARVGDAGRAFDYWRVTALTDLADLFGNSGHGLHMAALAGSWSTLVRGFAGMTIQDGLRFDPIAVPRLGDYGFALCHRGRRLRVDIVGDTARYTLQAGAPLDLHHGDDPVTVALGSPVERPLA